MKKIMKKNITVLAVIALLLAVTLSGCRPSPVIVQVYYTDTATEIDYDHEELDPDDEEGEEDEQFDETDDEDSERSNEEMTEAVGQPDPDQDTAPSDDQSARLVYSDNADSNGEAEGRTGVSDNDNKETEPEPETETGSEPETEPEPETESGSESEPVTEEEPSDDENETSADDEGENQEIPGDEDDDADKRLVTDANGQEQKLPEYVRRVIACGYAAQMTELLGGEGWLYASNADFTGSWLVKKCCPDVADGTVKTFWSGDGSSHNQLTVDFSEIENLGEGTLYIEISGQNTLTADQISRFEAGGGAYYVIPEVNSKESLINAVRYVEAAMNDPSASAKAQQYIDWVNGVSVTKGSMSYYGLYLTGYRNVGYRFTSTSYNYASLPEASGAQSGSGSGVATAYTALSSQLVTTYMNMAGISNESTDTVFTPWTKEVYVTPMFRNLEPVFSSDEYGYYNAGSVATWDYFLCHQTTGAGSDSYAYLGNEYFPAVIVADSDTRTAIENDWFWKYHGVSYWSSGGISIPVYRGYVPQDNSTMFPSSIEDDYEILVNPCGFSNWAEVSVDSPLEAYWAAAAITGTVSEAELYSKIKGFYNTFFSVSLSDGEVETILNGK